MKGVRIDCKTKVTIFACNEYRVPELRMQASQHKGHCRNTVSMFNGFHHIKMAARATLYIPFFAWILLALAGCGGDYIPVASVLSSGRVTLSWDDVPGAASYELYISTSPGVTVLNSYKIDDVTPPFTITDLEPGTTYYFMVAVFSDSGESRTSKEVAYTVTGTEGAVEFGDILVGPEPEEQAQPQPETQPTAKTPAAVAAAAATGQKPRSQPAAAPAVKSTSETIICFGDSLTAGTGATAGMDYPSQLARMIGKPVINNGIPGDTTSSALGRLNRDVLSANPDVVLITLGGNDLKNGIPRSTAFSNLKNIVESIQSRGSRVIIGGVKFPGNDRGFGKGYENLATQTGATLIPNILDGILDNLDRMSDAIHPNDAGYRIIAQRFEKALSSGQKTTRTSQKSNQTVSKKVAVPATVKAAPAASVVQDSASKTRDVILAWDRVANADSYTIYWDTSEGVTTEKYAAKIENVRNPPNDNENPSHPIKNLIVGNTYYFIVIAVNRDGPSDPSEELPHTVGEGN